MERDRKFPKDICLAAQHSQRATGIPACVTLAQWALESNFGKAMPAKSNNPFGIKARRNQPHVISRTQEWDSKRGVMITESARFAAYESIEAAFIAHGELLSNPKGPYRKSLPLIGGELEEYVKTMGRVYATDPNYARKLMTIILKYQLKDFNLPAQSE